MNLNKNQHKQQLKGMLQLTQSSDCVQQEVLFEGDEEVDVVAGDDLTQPDELAPDSFFQIQAALCERGSGA